jgi:hypothetical protein
MVLNISRDERAVTYVGPEIIEKLASVLEVDPAEFFRGPFKSGSRRKADWIPDRPGPSLEVGLPSPVIPHDLSLRLPTDQIP